MKMSKSRAPVVWGLEAGQGVLEDFIKLLLMFNVDSK